MGVQFFKFCDRILEEFPEHFVSPLRLSGSAVETLFSQFKHKAGGKLSATNYCTARAAHLIKHTVAYHHSSVSYRDVSTFDRMYFTEEEIWIQ